MQHLPFRKPSQQASLSRPLVLESCIEITRENITRKRVVFHGVCFHLNQDSLRKVEQAKENNCQLNLAPLLLADWRYYALVDRQSLLQSGLTFCTYYQQDDSEEAMMRSVISLDGNIIHQISSDCLKNSEFSRQITSAHYWLIEQLLLKLRLEVQGWLNWLSWSLSLLILAAVLLLNLEQLTPINPIMLLALLLMCWLLQWGIKRLLGWLLPLLRRWLLRELLFGLFSRRQRTRKIVWDILGRMGL
ncbi:MAG: hypothetical protein AB4426_34575 [Xenococcaceae cyanobacterium]